MILYLIIVYDISDIGVQNKIRNFLRRFLDHIQLSVFEGEVAPSQFAEIKMFLKNLHLPEDESVVVYVLRDQSRVERCIFGGAQAPSYNIIS